jgi:molybdopterin synthase sulfur carrier subunit
VTVRVHIPPVLRGVAGGRREMEADGETLQELLVNLSRAYPPLALHLFDEQGGIRRHILCIHDGNAIRPRDFASHTICPNDDVIVTNALAGG